MSLDFMLKVNGETMFSINITHNLTTMAKKCNVYDIIWRPEENGYHFGGDVISELRIGIEHFKKMPKYFKRYDDPNGWGTYDQFIPFLEKVLEACKEFPQAIVEVYR